MNTDKFTPRFHVELSRKWNALKIGTHTPKCQACQKYHTVGECGGYFTKYPLDIVKGVFIGLFLILMVLVVGAVALMFLTGLVSIIIGTMLGVIQDGKAPDWMIGASAVVVMTTSLLIWKFPKIFPALFPAPEPRQRHSSVIEAESTLNELEALIHQRAQQEGRK